MNNKEFDNGQVVYFIKKNGWKWSVDFGTVIEVCHNEVWIQMYAPKERRLINGIPYNDFETPTRWQKLPKKWTYNTKLFDLHYEPYDVALIDRWHIDKPNEVKEAIDKGLLVEEKVIDHSTMYTEIDKNKGWRIVRQTDTKYKPNEVSKMVNEVYATYQEAKDAIIAHDNELKRQASLTDYEWSVEQIDHTLNRALTVGMITPNEAELMRERLLAMDNVEDIETRLHMNNVQYKYWKNKRWITLEP